jgi:hypothetical protein
MADEEKADAPADDAAAKEDDGANAEEKADATDGGGDAASGEAEPAKAGSAAASGKPGPADFGLILTILGSFVGLYNSLTTYSYVPDDDIVLEMGKPGLVCVGAMVRYVSNTAVVATPPSVHHLPTHCPLRNHLSF